MEKLLKACLALVLVGTLYAQLPVKPTDGSGTELGLAPAGRRVVFYLQAITTSGVTITPNPTYVQMLFCTNTNASDRTLTVADTQGSPATFWSNVTLPGNSVVLLAADSTGLYMQGIRITASANSSVSCQVQGVQ